jgi:hypothetical protein
MGAVRQRRPLDLQSVKRSTPERRSEVETAEGEEEAREETI